MRGKIHLGLSVDGRLHHRSHPMDFCESVNDVWISFLDKIEPITRIWGALTSVVTLAVGVDLCFEHQVAGGFAIAGALITLFLEFSWAITILLQVCLRSESHPIVDCWDGVLWLDTYKRTVIYTVVAVLLFAQPHRPWFSTMAGLCLILLALLHAARWYKKLQLDNQSLLLLQQHDVNDEGYGNQVEIDLSMPEPIQQFEPEEQNSNHTADANNQQLDSGDMLRIVA